jgi:hypothetical protein
MIGIIFLPSATQIDIVSLSAFFLDPPREVLFISPSAFNLDSLPAVFKFFGSQIGSDDPFFLQIATIEEISFLRQSPS